MHAGGLCTLRSLRRRAVRGRALYGRARIVWAHTHCVADAWALARARPAHPMPPSRHPAQAGDVLVFARLPEGRYAIAGRQGTKDDVSRKPPTRRAPSGGGAASDGSPAGGGGEPNAAPSKRRRSRGGESLKAKRLKAKQAAQEVGWGGREAMALPALCSPAHHLQTRWQACSACHASIHHACDAAPWVGWGAQLQWFGVALPSPRGLESGSDGAGFAPTALGCRCWGSNAWSRSRPLRQSATSGRALQKLGAASEALGAAASAWAPAAGAVPATIPHLLPHQLPRWVQVQSMMGYWSGQSLPVRRDGVFRAAPPSAGAEAGDRVVAQYGAWSAIVWLGGELFQARRGCWLWRVAGGTGAG